MDAADAASGKTSAAKVVELPKTNIGAGGIISTAPAKKEQAQPAKPQSKEDLLEQEIRDIKKEIPKTSGIYFGASSGPKASVPPLPPLQKKPERPTPPIGETKRIEPNPVLPPQPKLEKTSDLSQVLAKPQIEIKKEQAVEKPALDLPKPLPEIKPKEIPLQQPSITAKPAETFVSQPIADAQQKTFGSQPASPPPLPVQPVLPSAKLPPSVPPAPGFSKQTQAKPDQLSGQLQGEKPKTEQQPQAPFVFSANPFQDRPKQENPEEKALGAQAPGSAPKIFSDSKIFSSRTKSQSGIELRPVFPDFEAKSQLKPKPAEPLPQPPQPVKPLIKEQLPPRPEIKPQPAPIKTEIPAPKPPLPEPKPVPAKEPVFIKPALKIESGAKPETASIKPKLVFKINFRYVFAVLGIVLIGAAVYFLLPLMMQKETGPTGTVTQTASPAPTAIVEPGTLIPVRGIIVVEYETGREQAFKSDLNSLIYKNIELNSFYWVKIVSKTTGKTLVLRDFLAIMGIIPPYGFLDSLRGEFNLLLFGGAQENDFVLAGQINPIEAGQNLSKLNAQMSSWESKIISDWKLLAGDIAKTSVNPQSVTIKNQKARLVGGVYYSIISQKELVFITDSKTAMESAVTAAFSR